MTTKYDRNMTTSLAKSIGQIMNIFKKLIEKTVTTAQQVHVHKLFLLWNQPLGLLHISLSL